MKKYQSVFTLTALLLAFTACGDEEEIGGIPTLSDQYISFGTSPLGVEVTPRAPIDQLEDGASFGVLGYCLAQVAPDNTELNVASGSQIWDYKKQLCRPHLFYKQKVSYNSGNCTYEPLQKWYEPTNYNYSFFGYYPYDSDYFTVNTTASDLGAPRVKFSIPFSGTDANTPLDDSQVPDAMVAQEIDVTRVAGQVQMNFLHILTGLNFQVNNYNANEDGTAGNPVTIHSLKLSGKFYKSIEINFDSGYDFPDETFYGTYTIVPNGSNIEIGGLESKSQIGDKTLLLVSNLNKTSKEDGYLGQLTLSVEYSFGNSNHVTKTFERPENFLPAGGTIYTAQLNFIGDSFVLNFIVDNNQQWEDGGDSDITFE